MGDDGTSCSWWILNFLLFSVWFRLAYSGIWIFMYRRSVTYYFSRAHSQSWYYCWSSFRQCIIMRSILCSMSLSVVAQKERKTYRRRRDILRGVRFFVSDLFQKRPSWRGRAVAGPFCLQKRKKKEKRRKKRKNTPPASDTQPSLPRTPGAQVCRKSASVSREAVEKRADPAWDCQG